MNPHDDERLPGEDELAALYHKLPDRQPGPALDAAVLRAAAEAVRPAAARSRRPRWPVMLGTAATLVLAFGLTWHMREWPSATRPAPMPAAVSAEHDEPAAAETAVAARTAPAPTPMPTARPESIAPPPPAAAAPRRMAPPDLDAGIEQRKSAPAGILASRQRAMSPSLPAIPAPINEATVAAAAPAAVPPPSQADAAALSDQAVAGAASKPAAQAFVAPVPAPFANQLASTSAPVPSNRSESMRAAIPEQQAAQEPAPVAAPADAPAPAPPPAVELAAKSYLQDPTAAQAGDTPAQELDKIRRLFALHRRDEARQRLAAFQRIHPDYALPAELRAQLPTP